MKRIISLIIATIGLVFSFWLGCFAGNMVVQAAENNEDLETMAHIIMGEAESASWDMKLAVGSVVLNRVSDDRFPETIYDVVWQAGQYSPTWDGRYWLEPNDECWEAAEYLLENGTQLPEDVVWQAEFPQGKYVYEYLEGNYFCG